MSSILLYHHLGLGDHIMCHGIVREYCRKHNKVSIFSKSHNYPSVSFMYRDLKNLTIIQGDDIFAENFILLNASKYDEVKRIGFQNLDRSTGAPLEWQFYQLAGVPFEKKWSSFFVERDFEKEHALYDLVAPKKDYAFVHEDRERHYIINRDKIGGDCEIITPDKEVTTNIFDYCTIIEKAREVHVIDSSFMFLIDCLPYHNPDQKLYIHRYARDNNEWQLPILKKDWYIFIQPHNKKEPLKDFLQWASDIKIPLLGGTLTKRAVRRIFTIMGWSMMRPKSPDIKTLIRRYIPGKSFIAISPEHKGNTYVPIAQTTGSTTATSSTLEVATPADTVFYSGSSLRETNLNSLLKQLHAITNETLIFHTTNIKPEAIESLLEEDGFSVREKHLFPSEVCFVCRVVPNK